jgi:antitoxin HicB
MRRYSIVLIPEEGQYSVVVPLLPGCVTFGATVDEAMEHARDAIRLYLDDAAAHDEEVPEETGCLQLRTIEV